MKWTRNMFGILNGKRYLWQRHHKTIRHFILQFLYGLDNKKRASENYMVGDRDSFQLFQMMKKVVTDCDSEMHLDDDRDTDDRSHHPPSVNGATLPPPTARVIWTMLSDVFAHQ